MRCMSAQQLAFLQAGAAVQGYWYRVLLHLCICSLTQHANL